MECAKCHKEANELEEHNGKWYCLKCITLVTIPAEVYTRVVGYLRPIQNFNEGKKQEVKDRKPFRVLKAADGE